MQSPRFTRLRKFLHVLTLCLPILIVFIAFVAPIACTLAWYHGTNPLTHENSLPAVICGLIASLFVVVFHVKKETTFVPFKNRQDFQAMCKVVLNDLGYEVAAKSDDVLVSWPSFRGLLLGGRIHIKSFASEGRIDRAQGIRGNSSQPATASQPYCRRRTNLRNTRGVRTAERRLKRIQISLRVAPSQWQEVGRSVVQKLADKGAEVICEMHLMAQCDGGIRESVIEGPIRDWLHREQIHAEIHKDHSRWDDARPVSVSQQV